MEPSSFWITSHRRREMKSTFTCFGRAPLNFRVFVAMLREETGAVSLVS